MQQRSDDRTVAVVMCTYNGEKYLREQLDSILKQTFPLTEIIIQDDGSSDKTVEILHEYEAKHDIIHVYRNETERGINNNFYSAMAKSRCDYIAIADQDDIWATDKIARQMSEIGDKMLCFGVSKPFPTPKGFDERNILNPNMSLIRLLFIGIGGGHTFLISRRLQQYIPLIKTLPRLYDAAIHIVAATFDSVVFTSGHEPLVLHRIYQGQSTYNKPLNTSNIIVNAARMIWRTCSLYRELRPRIREHMMRQLDVLNKIDAHTTSLEEAKTMARLLSQRGLVNFLRLQIFCMKNCEKLFIRRTRKTPLTLIRALFFPVSCCDYFRYMSKKHID